MREMREPREPPTMLYRYVDCILVGVHTSDNPREREWRQHCASLERLHHEMRGVLVYTDGGGPTGKQCQQLRLALHEHASPPAAILTSSAWVRGVISSLNWFLADQVAAFEPTDLDGALRYLARPDQRLLRDEIVQVLGVLATQLSVHLPPERPDSARHQDHP